MFNIKSWFYARQRQIDLEILWPACLDGAKGDLDRARAAFAVHAFRDQAWLHLGRDVIYKTIDNLDEVTR